MTSSLLSPSAAAWHENMRRMEQEIESDSDADAHRDDDDCAGAEGEIEMIVSEDILMLYAV